MRRAIYYKPLENGIVKCTLCPHYCLISDNEHGYCQVRLNKNGHLYAELFEKVSAMNLDPIEKKPLYHFFPGTKILSIGSLGCNMKCAYCQNYRISQVSSRDYDQTQLYTAKEIVDMARRLEGNIGIAFTYNEPGTFYEYMLEVAKLAQAQGLKTVMVTNGYINREPLSALIPYIDAFNVDLKAFTENFYSAITQSHLEPVKKTILEIAKSGKHMELTNLVIPGLNDGHADFDRMVRWIASEIGDHTVLHISRYFPGFQTTIATTPFNLLFEFYEIASKHLKFVYLGNILDPVRESTYCDNCHQELIIRDAGHIKVAGLDSNGNCTACGHHVMEYIH